MSHHAHTILNKRIRLLQQINTVILLHNAVRRARLQYKFLVCRVSKPASTSASTSTTNAASVNIMGTRKRSGHPANGSPAEGRTSKRSMKNSMFCGSGTKYCGDDALEESDLPIGRMVSVPGREMNAELMDQLYWWVLIQGVVIKKATRGLVKSCVFFEEKNLCGLLTGHLVQETSHT